MTNHKHLKKLLIGIILGCFVLGGIGLIGYWRYPFRSTRQYTGCVIEARETSLLLRFDIPAHDRNAGNLTGNLYRVDVRDAKFTSHTDSVPAMDDLQPGMLVDVTIQNLEVISDLLAPSIPDLSTVARIETDGKTDDALFQAGIDDLSAYGFCYKNGHVESALRFDGIMPQ